MFASREDTVHSFSRYAAGRSLVCTPANIDQVNAVYELARSTGRQIAIRGGGHSFDSQALHHGDTGQHIILSAANFDTDRIEFGPDPDSVTLGAGVQWGPFVARAMADSQLSGGPIRIPGTMQTGRHATVAGTVSGDCLSRFSGTGGKESHWIKSFRLLTPGSAQPINVTPENNRELFYAAIGGQGYLGFVTDATYRLIDIPNGSIARSNITTYSSFRDLIRTQRELVAEGIAPRAISSVWFTVPLIERVLHNRIMGAVFDSVYAPPSEPPPLEFPLYCGLDSPLRYLVETALARNRLANFAIHEFLYHLVKLAEGRFENNILEFLFFIDGNTRAKEIFERLHYPQQFPIIQQTFVVPADRAEKFSAYCMRKMHPLLHPIHPTECDMLFAQRDDCLMSASYRLDGFAITFGFEPVNAGPRAPGRIANLLRKLSKECYKQGGRIHLVKNLYVDRDTFRHMFSPQVTEFERIKNQYDPEGLLQNEFSDRFFAFKKPAKTLAAAASGRHGSRTNAS